MQETGCKKPGARNRMQETGCKKPGARNRMQETGCKKPDAKNRMQEAGCKKVLPAGGRAATGRWGQAFEPGERAGVGRARGRLMWGERVAVTLGAGCPRGVGTDPLPRAGGPPGGGPRARAKARGRNAFEAMRACGRAGVRLGRWGLRCGPAVRSAEWGVGAGEDVRQRADSPERDGREGRATARNWM